MPRLVPASSLVSPAVSIPGSQLRAGPAEHLQPCQHQHPAAAGGAPREQHLPVPPMGSRWSAAALSLPRALIGQRQLRRLPLAELPCAGAAVGRRQLQARLSLAKRRSRQPGPPRRKARRQPELSGQHRAGSRGSTGASAEDSSAGGVRENGTGRGRGRGALHGPKHPALPSRPPWNPRGVGLWTVGLG